MDFDQPTRRRMGEPFVPMINVVFLLLIFFLMTAQIAPPDPFELTPPEMADGGDPTSDRLLHLSPGGAFAYQELRGADAIRSVIAESDGRPIKLRVDGGMATSALAAQLKALAAGGAASVELITAQR